MENQFLDSKPKLIAYCGLYCANCGKLKNGKCPGCQQNNKASWCKIRSCCIEKNITSCAECPEYIFPNDCNKFNNIISKVFGLIFQTDRSKCIEMIRKEGAVVYAKKMTESGKMSLPKKERTI